jgi:uncharacterized surface protein with fasciclin (FAS1) repeats
MGDRANVCVKEKGEMVYLYTHWSGAELPEIVREALASPQGRARWDDASYLTRIIFSHMVKDHIDGETGYGIWSSIGDGTDRVVLVAVDEKKVFVNEAEYSFSEFCDLKDVEWHDEPLDEDEEENENV